MPLSSTPHTLWIPDDQTMRGMEPGACDMALCRPDMLALGVLYGGYPGAEDEQKRVLTAVNAFEPMREALWLANGHLKILYPRGLEDGDALCCAVDAALKLAGDAT